MVRDAAVLAEAAPGTGPVGAIAAASVSAGAPLPAEQEADQLYLDLSSQSLDPYWVAEQHIRALSVATRTDAECASGHVAAVALLGAPYTAEGRSGKSIGPKPDNV